MKKHLLLLLLSAILISCGSPDPIRPSAPAAPTGLSATAGDGQVTLSWTSVTNAEFYNIYYATTPGVTTASTKISNVNTPYTLSGLTNNTKYYFLVTAGNTGGESPISIEVSTAPSLAAPTGVSATTGDGQVTLSWAAVTDATSYNVYYGTAPGVTTAGTKIANVTSPTTITGLTNNTTYYFVVTAVDVGGESSLSSEISATPPLPVTPTGISATAGDGQVTLSWTAVTGAASYNIYYGTAAGITTASTKITGATSPATITNLTNKTPYYFVVTAVNAGGESLLSTEVSATPQLAGASAPATGSAINITDTYATLAGSFTNTVGNTTYTTETRFEWGTTTAYGNNTASLVYADPGNIYPSIGIYGLTAGTVYHYRFGIKTSDGTWWYGVDKTFTTTTLAAKTAVVTGLTYPAQFTVDATNVYWTEGIGSFNIYYALVTGVLNTSLTKALGVTSGKTITGLTNATTYFFKAAAVNSGVEGVLSSEVSAALQPPVAGVPTNVNVTSGDASVTVSWSAVTNATAYNIYYATASPVTIASTKVPGAISGGGIYTLINATKYYVRVTAVVGGIESALSSEVGVTPHAAVAAVPYWVGITSGNGQVTLTWTAETGVVKKAPLAGGATTTLASGLSNPVGLAVDATNVYWTEQNSASSRLYGAVRKVPIAGPACVGIVCTSLATVPLNNPQYIALDATNVYFTELGTFDTISGMRKSDGTVNKIPIGGGAVTALATAQSGPQTIAVDATNIYWTEVANSISGAGFVKKTPISGGAPTTLVSGLSGSQNIAADATDIYFWSGYGALSKVAIGGGNGVEVTSGMSGTQPLAMDATNVYWTENTNGGTVKKVAKATGNVSIIIVGLDCTWCTAFNIAQDATYVYWMEGDVFDGTKWTGVGAIKKVAK